MREIIEYVVDILNIKTQSRFTLMDIEEELQNIEDFGLYRQYIRSNINHFDTRYMTGFQKFITLTTRYKKAQELNSLPLDTLEAFSTKLYKKFADAIYVIRDHEAYLSSHGLEKVKFHGGEQVFTPKEIEVLNAIGSLHYLVNLYELHSLKKEIYNKCIQKSLRKIRAEKQLENKSDSAKRVLAIVSGVGRVVL